jgi:hypothetical protein
MVAECPMTEDRPGDARDRRMCLVQPGDCESSPADGEAALVLEAPEMRTPDTPADAVSG